MLIGIRQQGNVARPLDRCRQLALVVRSRAGYTAGHDLAGFGNVVFQRDEILVVNLFHVFRGEAAIFSAAEKSRHVPAPLLSAHFGLARFVGRSLGSLFGVDVFLVAVIGNHFDR